MTSPSDGPTRRWAGRTADAGTGPDGFQDDLRQRVRWAWRVVWRGKHLVLACLILAIVPTILLLKQTPPRYTAETRVLIEAPDVRDPLADRSVRSFMSDSIVQTEAALITSSTLARRVVDKLHLEDDPEFNATLRPARPLSDILAALNPLSWLPPGWLSSAPPGSALSPMAASEMAKAQVVRAFGRGLDVQAQRRSYIVVVSFTSENREKAALIANTVAEMYLLDRLEAGFEDARRVSGWLGERLEVLRRDVVAAESAVEEFRSQNGLRRKGDRQVTLTDQQLSELNSRLVIARSDLAQKQARLDQARSVLRSRGSAESTTDVLQSPLIQRLREQESSLLREMSDALKIYGDRHPRLVGLRAELNGVRGTIGVEVEKISSSFANDVEVAAAGVKSLERQLDGVRQQANTAGEAEIRLRELERQSEATRSLYESFLTRFKREAEQERMQRANARIVSPADLPVAKSYPREIRTLQIVGLLALLFGVGLVFLLDRLDTAIRSSDEAEDLTGLPVLGMIPLQRNRKLNLVEELLRKPRSALADAVRSLRTAITIGALGDSKVIMVTSSIPKEGKTFVSLCLALLFSKAEKRVLLIDADIHRPRLHNAIGIDGSRGLVQVLSGSAAFDDVVQHGAAGTLDVLPAGQETNTAELIKGPAMEAFLRDLLPRYDRIIIDTAPVLAVSDGRLIAPLVDRVIYLVRWNATPRDAVRNGLKLLRSAGAPPSGLVLSQVNQRKHSRYGYGDYGQYYGRYREYYAE
ncbi:polysaccharide biosynthesis tyrosine autokinase [Azospirillum sp. B506]|uniref:GumC family protein n=1 Tax=Azospirillum sp. B506 TaxID=137721 RepID=UPI000A078B07|nr:polysaccharide biosynthesis tyrosine autokinase [Azospirillum sp. B506]